VPATTPDEAYLDLWWLPLGAGGHVVRWNGRIYERLRAAPVWSERAPGRGVQVEGPVGSRRLGGLRAFRYEVRCWPEGRIPDADEAVDSPVRITEEPGRVEAVLALVARCPAYTWGRDELHCGDMWNSNSLVAWLLAATGEDMAGVRPPSGGRAPGWDAGLTLARAQLSGRRGGG